MGERHERLTVARKRAGHKSAMEAAKKNNWPPSTYASHENGQTPLPVKAAHKYAKAFKVSPAWLLTAEGDMHPAKNGIGADKAREAKRRLLAIANEVPHDNIEKAIDYLEFLVKR